MPPRCRRLLAAVAALGLLAGACGASPHRGVAPPSTTAPTASPTQADATAATLTIGLAGDPTNWNPLAVANRAATGSGGTDAVLQTVADAVLPSAFIVGPHLTPARNTTLLLSATQTSADPQTVRYRIDPRATWSDGVAVTAADFVYTWHAQSGRSTYRDRGGRAFTPASTAGYDQIASVTAGVDDDVVTVTFRSFDPDWQALFSPLLPAQMAERVGFDTGFTDPVTDLVSAGPYLVQSYQPGVDVVLVRNPTWWGQPADLSTVTVDLVDRADVATDSLLTDQLDADVLPFDAADVTELAANSGLAVTVTDSAAYDDLVFDERRAGLSSPDLRLAIALAVDRPALARAATAEGAPAGATVDNRAFVPGEAGYRDDAGQLGAGGVARADRLLVEAGYRRAGTTLERGRTPVSLTFAVESASPFSSAEAAAVRSAASALGIRLTTAAAGAAADLSIVAEAVSPFPSALASQYGPGDPSGYSSATMDELLATAGGLADGPAREAAVDGVDDLAWSAAVDLPLLWQPTVVAVQRRYTGLAATPGPDGPGYDIASWALPQKS